MVVGLLLGAGAGRAGDPSAPFEQIASHEPAELSPDYEKGMATAIVPVELAKGAPDPLVFEVQWATHGGRDFGDAFGARVAPSDPSRIIIEARLDGLPSREREGKYDLTLAAAGEVKGGLAFLELRFPSSELLSPAPLVIDCRGFLDPCGTKDLPVLRLRSKVGPLPLDARVDLVEGPHQDGVHVSGRVAFVEPQPILPDVMALPLEKLDGFPLGKSTAKLRVAAPAAAPQDIQLEVRRRAPSLYLLLVALGGIGTGFLVRVVVQRWIDDGLARVEVGRIAAKLAEERAACRDDDLADSLQDLDDRLTRATDQLLQHVDEAARKNAKTECQKIQTDLEKALEDHEKRKAAVQKEASTTEALLEGRWQLPNGARSALERARTRLAVVQDEIARGDPKGAAEQLQNLRKSAIEDLAVAWNAYRDVRRELPKIRRMRPALPERVAAETSTAFDRLDDNLSESAPPTGEGDDTLRKLLELPHSGRQRVRAMLETIGNGILGTVERSIELYEEVGGQATASEWTAARALAKNLVAAERIDRIANGSSEELGAWCSELREALKEIVDVVTRSFGGHVPAEVADQLNAGQYVAVASKAVIRQRPGGAALGASRAETPREVAAQVAAEPDTPPAERPLFALTSKPVVQRVQVDVPRALREVARAQLLQTAFSTLGLLGLAYVVFNPGWFGSLRDCASVFAWAFTLDVGVGTIASEAKSRLAPRTA